MQLEFIWKQIREPLIVPMLRWTVYLCLGLSLIMLVEKVYMAIVICYVKLFKRTPEKRYKFEAIEDDVELGNTNYPMVLVQIPMYNEREVNFQCWLFTFKVSFQKHNFLSLIHVCCSNCRFISYQLVLRVNSLGLLIESSYKFLTIQLTQQSRYTCYSLILALVDHFEFYTCIKKIINSVNLMVKYYFLQSYYKKHLIFLIHWTIDVFGLYFRPDISIAQLIEKDNCFL